MKIISYNLRVPSDSDGVNQFQNRAGLILQKIDDEKPDIIGFQEANPEPMMFFKRHLSEYNIIFSSRTEDFRGEGLAIAYRKDCMELHTIDRFWLSPTPRAVASRYEGQSSCPRICQVALLQNLQTGNLFRVYNIHLDHVGVYAQNEGIKQVLRQIRLDYTQTPYPLFLLGDFNTTPDSEVNRLCDNHTELPLVDLTAGIPGTFHGYRGDARCSKIDYIYSDTKTAQRPHAAAPWKDCNLGVYLSDHFPVCLDIDL